MKAEIIAVGSELLLGDVINSNAAWISHELAGLGIDVHHHVTVGDNPVRIQQVVSQALERSDLLIFTGGLGPTEDDLTIATLADYFGAPLIVDPESEKSIRDYFIARGMPMSSSNLKQAKKPEGSITIRNPIGTAPGIAWDVSKFCDKNACLLTFPGVPKELYAMWPQGRDFITQKRLTNGETGETLVSHYLHFFGIGESKLGELLADLMQGKNPTVAPYVGNAQVKIRIAAKASDTETANAMIQPLKFEIIKRCQAYYLGEGDCTLESAVAEELRQQNQTISVAESCTGGLISSRLTDVPGSSAYIFVNMVTYGNREKTRFLGVNPETLETAGAVSPEVAAEMATGIQRESGQSIGLAITGIAGPDGGSDEKPVGLAYIGLARPSQNPELPEVLVKRVLVNPRYARADIKYWFSQYALFYTLQLLRGKLESDCPPNLGLRISAAQTGLPY